VAFSAKDLKVASRLSLAPCQDPTGLALDADKGRLFAGCGNQLMAVIDAAKGKVLTTLPIGRGVDGTAFDPERRLAFSSNGEGTLSVVHEDSPGHFAVIETVPTQAGARTLALDPGTHRLYLSTAQFGPAPSPTPERPRPRGAVVPGSFVVLVVGP
jgi:DNA-binding beta-propeller fold protein YncE